MAEGIAESYENLIAGEFGVRPFNLCRARKGMENLDQKRFAQEVVDAAYEIELEDALVGARETQSFPVGRGESTTVSSDKIGRTKRFSRTEKKSRVSALLFLCSLLVPLKIRLHHFIYAL